MNSDPGLAVGETLGGERLCREMLRGQGQREGGARSGWVWARAGWLRLVQGSGARLCLDSEGRNGVGVLSGESGPRGQAGLWRGRFWGVQDPIGHLLPQVTLLSMAWTSKAHFM